MYNVRGRIKKSPKHRGHVWDRGETQLMLAYAEYLDFMRLRGLAIAL